jgi:hypothetical protein
MVWRSSDARTGFGTPQITVSENGACGDTSLEQGITGHCSLQLRDAVLIACERVELPRVPLQPSGY